MTTTTTTTMITTITITIFIMSVQDVRLILKQKKNVFTKYFLQVKNLHHHQQLLQHSNEPSTGVFISPVAEDQETPTIRIISKHETVIATVDKGLIFKGLNSKFIH